MPLNPSVAAILLHYPCPDSPGSVQKMEFCDGDLCNSGVLRSEGELGAQE